MSISNSYPTQTPLLNLNFATGSDQFLDSRISFSRADTPPTYAAPSAVHYWSNEKALNSENLFSYSNVYDSGGWLEVRVNQTIGQTDPSGGTAAKLITQASGQTNAGVIYYTSTVGAEELTFSIYLKPNGRTKPNLSENLTDSGNTVKRTYFDLTGAGAVGTKDAAHTASIAKFGDWYRCTITFTPHAADSGSVYLYLSDTDNSQTVADDGNGYIVYGANLSTTGQLITNETSGSIHREFAPTLKSVANAGDPRFEYDPTDGQSVGLLIEAQKSNLALNSNDFTNATWNKQRVTVTDSAAIGPDGQLSASLLAETTDTTTLHFMLPTAAITSGYSVGADKCTHSVFAKYAGKNLRMADGYNSPDGGSTIFDLQNGTVVSGGGSIQSCGNGWYRCSVTVTMSASTLLLPYIQLVDGTTWPNASDAGDGYSGVLIFGCQTEQQSMSSYITSGSASVSRASDSCSVALNGILASGQDVTLYAEGDWGDYTVKPYNRFLATLSENTDPSWIALYNAASSGASYVKYQNNLEAVQTGVAANGNQKAAVSVAMNSIKHAAAGVASAEDTSATVPPYTQLNIGNNRDAGSLSLNGHCARVALYGQALSSSELAALTSS